MLAKIRRWERTQVLDLTHEQTLRKYLLVNRRFLKGLSYEIDFENVNEF
jgi:hypothetical protein